MEYYTEAKEKHFLAGIILIAKETNKILLVFPKKFETQKGEKLTKEQKRKWSIPKGHIENTGKIEAAKKELKEETGISIFGNPENSIEVAYEKSRTKKKLTAYVFYSDVEFPVGNYDRKEISKIKYFTQKEALKKVEPYFKKMIKQAFAKNI